MQAPPWAFRPDLRGAAYAEDANFSAILARCLRIATPSAARDVSSQGDWSVAEDEVWLIAGPNGRARRDQGWKIHISATVASAGSVLARVLPIVLERRCHFKLAKSRRQLEILNGLGCPEGIAGKFMTVYPDDDRDAVELSQLLDAATGGLDGPRILSDRPFRPGSLVHVRYGAFRGRVAFTPYGLLQPVIARPDGGFEEDRRLGRFAPPVWAEDPFAVGQIGTNIGVSDLERTAGAPSAPRVGRYRIEAALKRSNRGGTFRARSIATGARPEHGEWVILKEARPQVATDRFGRDACDRLRHELAILGATAALGEPGYNPAPRPIELFAHGGHLFLAREFLAGTTLRTVVRRRFGTGRTSWPEPDLRAMARGLADLLRRFHDAGLIVRDFNPNNLLLLSDRLDHAPAALPGPHPERTRGRAGTGSAPPMNAADLSRYSAAVGGQRFALVDLELAHDTTGDALPFRGATLAYASPQQEDDLAPTFADDVFAFGATLAFVATGADPFFLPDAGSARSVRDKLADRLALHHAPVWAVDLVLACLAPIPDDRPTIAEVVRAIVAAAEAGGTGTLRTRAPGLPSERDVLAAVDGVVDYLAAAAAHSPCGGRHWPTTAFGAATDPRCVAHGSAGVGLFLLQRHGLGATNTTAALLETVIRSTETAPEVEGHPPAGLYYGEAGVAWFLADAATALDRPELRRRALDLLSGLPSAGVSPDLMVGTAGLGLAAVRLFLATGDPVMHQRAAAAARALRETAQASSRGPAWPIPADFAVDRQSKIYPGYAYGLTGIASFLLAAAEISGDDEPADLARAALHGLLDWRQERDGRRWWPTSSHSTAGSPCWLKGVSGIGAGLVRAFRSTGESRYGEAALDCWRMIRPAPRHGPLTQLHGLAGIGAFFLDVADVLGEEGARTDAWDVARTIYAARIDRRIDGFGICFPDEDGLAAVDLMTGTVGVASFLLRLVRRTPRLLTLDDLLGGGAVGRWDGEAGRRGLGRWGDEMRAGLGARRAE